MRMFTRFYKKGHSIQSAPARGQSIIEYAGMIVLSTLMVGCLMSGTKQIMPVLFTALSHRNADALSDTPPLPAADFPSPSTESSEQPANPNGNALPEPEKSSQSILPPVEKAQVLPALTVTDAQQEQLPNPLPLPEPRRTKPTPGLVTPLEPHQAYSPMVAPPPRMATGPKAALPAKVATDPRPGLQPRLAPSPIPAPEPKVISAPLPLN